MAKIQERLDKFYETQLNEQEAQALAETLVRFLNSYAENKDSMPINEWLEKKIKEELPNTSFDEIKTTTHDIIEVIKCINEEKEDLLKARSKGVSIKSWLVNKIKKFIQPDEVKEVTKELKRANIYDTLEIARCSDENVDIEAIEPEVIEEGIEKDDNSPAIDKIGEFAEESLKRTALAGAQSAGKYILENSDFNFSKIWDAACSGAKEEAKNIINETINGETKTDTLKTITSGALKVFTEQNPRPLLPVKTGGVLGSIASTSIEHIKTLKEVADGNKTVTEAATDIAIDTAATVAGNVVGQAAGKIGMAAGAKIGGTIGSIFGPAGTAIGAAVGGAIGNFAGRVIGSKVVQGAAKVAKKVTSAAVEGVKAIGRGAVKLAKGAFNAFCSLFS